MLFVAPEGTAFAELREYLHRHAMVNVNSQVAEVIFSEVIVDNWEELVERVYALGFRISQVGWWEHTPIGSTPVLGSGGHKELTNPDFYFADIYMDGFTKDFSFDAKPEQIKSYILKVQGEFECRCKMVPAFTIIGK